MAAALAIERFRGCGRGILLSTYKVVLARHQDGASHRVEDRGGDGPAQALVIHCRLLPVGYVLLVNLIKLGLWFREQAYCVADRARERVLLEQVTQRFWIRLGLLVGLQDAIM